MSRTPCKTLTRSVVETLRARILTGEFSTGVLLKQHIETAGQSIKQLFASR
ncbi:DNA-binding GntR family transcriptional regulator [Oceanisphaera litoralis]|uniref:hypothetical protein n=1 Tax=Oceanisphaera litoralis TaxID=225144 RepID=UPI00195A96DD|nr:hypothetical protein [Oceanisphaera litoralis]MBM7456189.1 DNA-binding GntR family transcriptional regulator [Oceanisphaera litoralis]